MCHTKQLELPTRRRNHRLLAPLTWLLILSESVRKIRRAAATNMYCGCHAKTIDSSTAECGGALRTLYTFHSGVTSQLNTAELPPHIGGENIPLYALSLHWIVEFRRGNEFHPDHGIGLIITTPTKETNESLNERGGRCLGRRRPQGPF